MIRSIKALIVGFWNVAKQVPSFLFDRWLAFTASMDVDLGEGEHE